MGKLPWRLHIIEDSDFDARLSEVAAVALDADQVSVPEKVICQVSVPSVSMDFETGLYPPCDPPTEFPPFWLLSGEIFPALPGITLVQPAEKSNPVQTITSIKIIHFCIS